MDIVERLRRAMNATEMEQITREAATEIERLRAAIKWALGEVADDRGCWFGETIKEHIKPYGWRTNLRRMTSLNEQQTTSLDPGEPRRLDAGNQGSPVQIGALATEQETPRRSDCGCSKCYGRI